jgi:excinuclease ABC subunit C
MDGSVFERQLRNLPHVPGVYIMKDARSRILYIGKASDLKKRVSSYFRGSVKDLKTKFLTSKVHSLEFYTTANETEAFILEANLIQKEKPPYNIRLKDDKRYPYLAITSGAYPRIVVVRQKNDRHRSYFGPYTNASAMRKTLEFINKSFLLRKCDRPLAYGKRSGKPCLYHQIGQCKAPCTGEIPESEYEQHVEKVELFLQGKYETLVEGLKAEMEKASAEMRFEQAARIRDLLASLADLEEKQHVNIENAESVDAFHAVARDGYYNLSVFFIRSEKIVGRRNFIHEDRIGMPAAEILSGFLRRFYEDVSELPAVILLPFPVEDSAAAAEWLGSKFGHPVEIRLPHSENEKRFIRLQEMNAAYQLEEFLLEKQVREKDQSLLELKEALHLPKMPYHIEGFDNSNLGGANPVASMVCFRNGMPDRKNYRHFKIRTVTGSDDFATMQEVIGRRYQRVLNEKMSLPDLILIDGGAQQLQFALKSLDALGVRNCQVIGLAKREEEIYLPGAEEPVRLAKDSKALHLLQRVRDEAHRFAVSFHRKLRDQNFLPRKK